MLPADFKLLNAETQQQLLQLEEAGFRRTAAVETASTEARRIAVLLRQLTEQDAPRPKVALGDLAAAAQVSRATVHTMLKRS